ncbi:MAG: hypothetical protein EBY20_01670 [Alphaproteobacteria bacterium]|nr:hypothetical protein [Alphaproteobacteria bacterium]
MFWSFAYNCSKVTLGSYSPSDSSSPSWSSSSSPSSSWSSSSSSSSSSWISRSWHLHMGQPKFCSIALKTHDEWKV